MRQFCWSGGTCHYFVRGILQKGGYSLPQQHSRTDNYNRGTFAHY